jgi:serine protease AprX
MRTNARFILVGALLVLGIANDASAGSITPELKETLAGVAPDATAPVIVTLSDQVDLKAFQGREERGLLRARLVRALRAKAGLTQAPLLALLNARGATGIRSLWINNSIAVTTRAGVIRDLAERDDVASIGLDSTFGLPEVTYSASASPEWNLAAIHAPELWSLGYGGAGVVVASMDTGVDLMHPDLATRWRGGSNSWFDPSGQHALPYDRFGHGTQVMGILVGGDAGGTAIGVAPFAQWVAVKIFNDAGYATLSGIHLGFQWILNPDGNPDTDDAPDVVNNSWGLQNTVNLCSTEFAADIAALRAAEVAIVFAAGNFGPNPSTSISPANNLGSLAVGASNESSGVAGMSSRGPSACGGLLYPGVVAPGVNVQTADLTYGGVYPSSYVSVSGTSFAAPHVSGAMALLLSAFPSARVTDLEAALAASAVDLGTPGPDNESGSGLIDVVAAYDHLIAALQVPSAVDDAYATDQDTRLEIAAPGVLANDSDPQGEPLTAVLSRDVAAGTLTLYADGRFVYTPGPGFVGTDSFTYAASDGVHTSGPATVTLTVNPAAPANEPPLAQGDAAGTPEDTPVVIDVLTNDTDPDGDVLTVGSVTQAAHGTVTSDGDSVTYTPSPNFAGIDSFTYTASDGEEESPPATVTISVSPVNDPPTAANDAASTSRNVAVTINVIANDQDIDGTIAPATVAIATAPRKGKAVPRGDGTVTYSPNRNFKGTDTFTYKVRDDGGAGSNAATVTITVK